MNKFLVILSIILVSSSAYANCLIDDIGTACSIADFRKPMNTSFGQNSHVPDFSENPDVRLNILNACDDVDFMIRRVKNTK